jgi:hypothetical protein
VGKKQAKAYRQGLALGFAVTAVGFSTLETLHTTKDEGLVFDGAIAFEKVLL